MYEKIKEQLIKENKERLKDSIERLDFKNRFLITETERINFVTKNILDKRTNYKGTFKEQRTKIIKALNNKYKNQLQEQLNYLEQVSNAIDFNILKIGVEWRKSKMWGLNPTATDNFGHDSGNIGGCGYDKLSTAVAKILNKHLFLIKLMCDKKEQALRKDKKINTRELLGYGSGYGIIPSFEGGVGIDSLINILKNLGLEIETINTKASNCYLIKQK